MKGNSVGSRVIRSAFPIDKGQVSPPRTGGTGRRWMPRPDPITDSWTDTTTFTSNLQDDDEAKNTVEFTSTFAVSEDYGSLTNKVIFKSRFTATVTGTLADGRHRQ